MQLDEDLSKALLAASGVPVSQGIRLTPDDIEGSTPVAPPWPGPWYIKALVRAGGRGKAGGVLRVTRAEDLAATARRLFTREIKGERPRALRLEPGLEVLRECYVSMAVSRTREELVFTCARHGGMEVERQVAQAGAADAAPLIQPVDLAAGPQPHQVRAGFFRLGLERALWEPFADLVKALWKAVRENGLLLAEINPLAVTPDGLVALDAKVELDESLRSRPALAPYVAAAEAASAQGKEGAEALAAAQGLSYVPLTGWVGLVANGAGLAMATMDLLNYSGLPAANFLDLGGTADAARIRAAFRILFDDPAIRAVVINLYGGILSCGQVARAMAEVLGGAEPDKPLVVRLAGNGADEGVAVLSELPQTSLFVTREMDAAITRLAELAKSQNLAPSADSSHVLRVPEPARVAVRGSGAPAGLPRFDLPPDARVLVQGATGKVARLHTRLMRAYGTNIVAGVTPFKGGEQVEGVPVYDSVAEAVERHQVDASIVFVPGAFAPDAILEAAQARIPWIVCITEHIPQQEMLAVTHALRGGPSRLVGPNTPGVIIPGACKLGIMPPEPFSPGPVAVFSRSGTLTYEAAGRLSAAGIGQAYAVGIGGDPFVGLRFTDLLDMAALDDRVQAVLVLGEIGGSAEERLAARVLELRGQGFAKPVLAFVAGRTAPPGKRLGHAGAILEEASGGEQEKLAALAAAGVRVCASLEEIPRAVAAALG